MANERSIFERTKLRPGQLRTVADRRFEDAVALINTRHNSRANGAMYLGGFVLECLLKAALLERHTWLQNAGTSPGRSRDDQRLWSLCYRLHHLDEILARLPDVRNRILALGERGRTRLLPQLNARCASWTIFARYSPHSAMMGEAEDFLQDVRELKPWLR